MRDLSSPEKINSGTEVLLKFWSARLADQDQYEPKEGRSCRTRLFAIYIAAHLPLFAFFDTRFWDDWALNNASAASLISIFDQAGAPLTGYFHAAVMSIGWATYPLLSFVSLMIVVLCTFELAIRLGLGTSSSFWIAAFSAVLPINFARVAAINVPSAILMAIFMVSWLALVGPGRRHILFRVIAVGGFFLSFQLSSLLVLYVLPAVWHLAQQWEASKGQPRGRHAAGALIMSSALILLPVLYWLFKMAYLAPYGLFLGYNSPALGFRTLINTGVPLWDFFKGNGQVLDMASIAIILAIALLIPAAFYEKFQHGLTEPPRHPIWFILTGLAVCLLAAFPYAAVDRLPSAGDWTSSRHQITMCFGLPILMYGLISLCLGKLSARLGVKREIVPVLLVAILVVNWWAIYAEFYTDHVKQRAFIMAMEKGSVLRSGNFVLIDFSNMSAFKTQPGPAEYAAMHAAAGFKNDTLIIDYSLIGQYSDWKNFTEGLRKYFVAWTKMEAVDIGRVPQLYVLRSKVPIANKLVFASKMFLLHIFRPRTEKQLLKEMLTIDGPFPAAQH